MKTPEASLAEVRAANKKMCDRCPFMPPFNPGMIYVLIAKTHFTFGHMPVKQGGHNLFDLKKGNSVVPIRLKLSDQEGRAIQESGIIAVIYDEGFFADRAAMSSMASQEIMNQLTQLQESELNCFANASFLHEQLTQDSIPPSEADLLKHIEASGLGVFSP